MDSLLSANLLMVLISLVMLLGGFYLILGLCCKGSSLSRLAGGVLGAAGGAGYLLSLLPGCL